MKKFKQSKRTIEKLMKKNGKKSWWIILAALIVAGIQACGSTWNLRENQININVKKNENRSRERNTKQNDEPGDMDSIISTGKQANGGNDVSDRSDDQSMPL